MTQFAYTPETWAALTWNPEDRSKALRRLLEKMGGRLVSFYNSFEEYDGLFIYEAPDGGTAAATVLAAISPGHVESFEGDHVAGRRGRYGGDAQGR